MVQQSNSRFSSLAADRLSAAWSCCAGAHSLTSPVKTRVWGCSPSPSGRPSYRGRRRRGIATGSRPYAYKTASGRTKWLSRDPIAEDGFLLSRGLEPSPSFPDGSANLYGFVLNNPISLTDPLGLEAYDSCKEDKTQGGFRVTRSAPTGRRIWVPGLGDVEEMRVVQRKCNFRCYHEDTSNCEKIPCKTKTCALDHGVAIQITVNAAGPGAAATCKEIVEDVRQKIITGGSIARDHRRIIKAGAD